MQQPNRQTARGFTLIELCVTTAIASILAASAVPSFSGIIERQRIQGAIDELTLALSMARSEALASGDRVAIAPRAERRWTTGWRVFRDANDNGELDAGETVLQESVAPHPSISIDTRFGSTRNVVLSYGDSGFIRRPGSNALLMGSMVISNGRTNRVVCFGATRVRVAEGTSCQS